MKKGMVIYMFKDREKLYQAYHTILTMALTWALILAINQYYEFRVPIVLGAIFSFVPALLIYLFNLYRKNTVTYLLIGSFFPLVALILWMRKVNLIVWISDLIDWCTIYNGSEELYVKHHANFLIFSIASLGAVVFFLITKKQLEKIILAIILMATLIILSLNKVEINKAVVSICIFYILTIIVELYGIIYSRKAGKPEKKEGILYLAPICLLLAVLSISLPSKEEPIQWSGIRRIYSDVVEQIEVWKTDLRYYLGKNESEFIVNLTGYSEDNSELNNNDKLIEDNKVALKISGSQRNRPIYLIGSVSDVYAGSRWEKSRLDYVPGEMEYELDYGEMIYALSRQTPEVLQNNQFLERITLKVNYNNIKTKTFFYPIKTSWYDMFTKGNDISSEPANITFSKVRGRGTSYQSIFYEMNLQGDAFVQMLRESDAFSYDKASSVNLDSALWLQDNLVFHDNADYLLSRWNFYELLGDRAEMIKKQYTNLPDTLPDRVRELAEELTAGYDSKYDKLKAIEEYLRTYEYNFESEKAPRGEDFTDYFLFESKKGYCTAYATAMAVLGRCIGVPTRYVEGFVAKFQFMDDDNMFPVRNSQAHAWAEAYFEGVGWIPFEATSPFYDVRYTKWADLTKEEGATGLDIPDSYEQYLHNGEGSYQPDPNALAVMEEAEASVGIINGLIIFLAAILILIVLLIIYYCVLKYRYRKTFDKSDYSKKMYMLFLRILRLLKQEGFVLGQQETIQMLSKRVKDQFYYDRVDFPEVANIFMHYRYADADITKKEYEQVAAFHEGLSTKQRAEESKFKAWVEEFIFLAKKRNY
jgi:transglutaminase-like putative cysteine protease